MKKYIFFFLMSFVFVLVLSLNFPVFLYEGDSETTLLMDSLPDVSGSNFSYFRATKLSPVENLHSGNNNEIFFLWNKDSLELVFEYFTSKKMETLLVLFTKNHKIIKPNIITASKYTILNNGYEILVKDNYTQIRYSVPSKTFFSNEFNILIKSRTSGFLKEDGQGFTEVINYTQHAIHYFYSFIKSFTVPVFHYKEKLLYDSLIINNPRLFERKGLDMYIYNRSDKIKNYIISENQYEPKRVKVASHSFEYYQDILENKVSDVVITSNPFDYHKNIFFFWKKWERPRSYFLEASK